MDHGYVFSMAVGTIGEWLNWSLFLLGDEQLIHRGQKINIVARKSLEINILTRNELPDPPTPLPRRIKWPSS